MFPRAMQDVLDDWVAGKFSSAAFLQAVDWPTVWGYDANLYLPLFHFCRQQQVKMLALNCHRPLVTRVGKEGWAAIPEDERDGLTPAADATPAYRKHLFDIMGGNGGADAGEVGRRSGARSFHSRAADLGSRVRLQHCAGAGATRSAAGYRHHRLGPSALRSWHAVSAARSRHRQCLGAAADIRCRARRDEDRRHRRCDLSAR